MPKDYQHLGSFLLSPKTLLLLLLPLQTRRRATMGIEAPAKATTTTTRRKKLDFPAAGRYIYNNLCIYVKPRSVTYVARLLSKMTLALDRVKDSSNHNALH